jgi:hypothetical protein
MTNDQIEQLRYPIGQFQAPSSISRTQLTGWIKEIKEFPAKLEALVKNLSKEQLDSQYRPGGWSVRQVIHHLADSHTNAYIRCKWTLTENTPTIKAYHEDRWADLFDSRRAPIGLSLTYLHALHAKWTYLLEGLTQEQLSREYFHPDSQKTFRLDTVMGLYDWHCRHHYAHIQGLIQRKAWITDK